MSDSHADLMVAGFLDSTHGRAIVGVRPTELRRAALLIVESLTRDLGVRPNRADGDVARQLLQDILPRKLGSNDPLVARMPEVIRGFFSHLFDAEMVASQYEIEVALAEFDDDGFAGAVKAVAPGERIGSTTKTVAGRGEKVGRNDPCPCGSGKKFKKCCATLGES